MERADVAGGGVRLTLPLSVGPHLAEIVLEPGHCERLFRAAAYGALRDGRLAAGARVAARLAPGRVRDRHGAVDCLESCRVELFDASGRVAADVEFPRRVFAAFVAARAAALLVEGRAGAESPAVAFSLHAVAAGNEAYPVSLPALPRLSVGALAAAAAPHGTPEDGWITTFVTPEVVRGLGEIEAASRASGVEAAGRIDARIGIDTDRRRFVRILDRVVIARETRATATTVVSTAASWAEFLAGTPADGPRAISSLHTHLHLEARDADGAPGDHLLAAGGALGTEAEPCISIDDIVTHYTAFPDPLSAALIVSLFPDRRVVTVYGYTPGGELREEPGYWTLRA
jgi:hypothetical protein